MTTEFYGTFVTNFASQFWPVYEAAIDEFGDPDLFLQKEPSPNGRSRDNSFHIRERKRLDEFWEIYDKHRLRIGLLYYDNGSLIP